MYAILEDLRYLKQMKKTSIIQCILWSFKGLNLRKSNEYTRGLCLRNIVPKVNFKNSSNL